MGDEKELSEKLEKIEHLEEDNNKILHKLYRALQWERAMKLIYLLLVLSVMFGAYYYIQPYVGDFVEIYTGVQGALDILKTPPPR